MHALPRSEYPRPNFVRENWLCLNGDWEFSIGEKTYERTIIVPFACETALSGISDRGFHRKVYYRKQVILPLIMQGLQLILHFGAVDYSCRVFVNGHLVASHEGGQTAFETDITRAVLADMPIAIEVEVEDDPFDLEMPRGKQFWEGKPNSIFYDRTTGIWQSVWMEAVSPLHLKQCFITPMFDERAVQFDYELSIQGSCAIDINMLFQGNPAGHIRADALSISGTCTVHLDQQALQQWNFREDMCWTPETPRLFDVHFTVLNNGEVCDLVRSYFGMRKVSVEKGVFSLNNRPYYQKLVLDQGYWPNSLLTAPCDEDFITDICLIKNMGFNGVRKHQKIEDPRFLYHADRLGLLVWGEIGSAYLYSRKAATRLHQEWQEAVQRDYNHPCIIAWTPLNESWGVQEIYKNEAQQSFCMGLYHFTRSLDTTRLIISNDGWEHTDGDLLTIHDYSANGQQLRMHFVDMDHVLKLHPGMRPLFADGYGYRGEPVLVSEFGGVKFTPGMKSEKSWGYSEAVEAGQYEEMLRDLFSALQSSSVVQGYCYTQLTDVGTETNGLLTSEREPKISVDRIFRINEGG